MGKSRHLKRKWFAIPIPLIIIGTSLGVALPLIIDIPSNGSSNEYIGNMTGTDWRGYESGALICTVANGAVHTNPYCAGNWVIPDFVTDGRNTYPLVRIDNNAFNNESSSGFTDNLTIGNNITTIMNGAFNKITGTSGILTFGKSVTNIGVGAFTNCSSFDTIIGNFDSQPTVGEGAFYGFKTPVLSLTFRQLVLHIATNNYIIS